MNSKHYFYVILCSDNTLYAGYTTSLKRRLQQHRNGSGAKYLKVKKRHPFHMIYAEAWSTQRLAMQAEYRFKQLTRPQKESYLKAAGCTLLTPSKLTYVVKEETDANSNELSSTR